MAATSLKKQFTALVNVDYEASVKKSKLNEVDNMTFNHDDDYYKKKVFNGQKIDDIEIGIEFCETQEQNDLWTHFRVYTSSIRTFKNPGRNIRFMVKDNKTDTYIGIVSLASDVKRYEARDTFIGWSFDKEHDSAQMLKYVVNINCCVGLQPFSYNFNAGKLLVALCYSKEVQDYHFKKYGQYFACVTTFSINEKSIQYDRMKPYLQYIGKTKGFGILNVPDKLYERLKQLQYLFIIVHKS